MNNSSLKIAALKAALVVLATDVDPLNYTSLNNNDFFTPEVPKIINSFHTRTSTPDTSVT